MWKNSVDRRIYHALGAWSIVVEEPLILEDCCYPQASFIYIVVESCTRICCIAIIYLRNSPNPA